MVERYEFKYRIDETEVAAIRAAGLRQTELKTKLVQ